ncbi:MAG: hypothetical protein AAF153_03445, partial [Pseudomonadota bacterium]
PHQDVKFISNCNDYLKENFADNSESIGWWLNNNQEPPPKIMTNVKIASNLDEVVQNLQDF